VAKLFLKNFVERQENIKPKTIAISE